MIRHLALSILGFLTLGMVAHAADLAAPARSVPVFQTVETLPNWTGFYVGLTAGGAFGDTSKARASYEDGTAYPGTVRSKSNTGVSVGGTLGYNQQFGSFVAGVEGDYSFLSLTKRTSLALNETTGTPAFPATYQANGDVRSKIGSFGTVRGRLGYLVTPSFLVYGTGGLAFADVSNRGSVSEGITVGSSGTYQNFATYTGRNSGFKTGFAYGGGAEYKIDRNWSVKLEALRVQLPDSRLFAGNETEFGYNVRKIKNDFTVVRAGVNYTF